MRKFLKILWFFTKLGIFFGFLGIVTLFLAYKYYEPELPSVESIREYKLQVPLRVYSEDGMLMAVFGTKRREPVRIDEIPDWVKQAYIAAEDANFYDHYGFDPKGIMRAVWKLAITGKKSSGGGSTITQQLTRNVFLTLDQTWTRKIKELFLAIKLERTISKDEILELYLNKIPLGHRAYGIAAAADVYYGKQLHELTLAESAMLAAPPKAPSRINPVTSPERALQRRNYVLNRMRELEFITEDEYQQAVNEEDRAYVHQPALELNAPWVAEIIRSAMVERFGEAAYTDGYTVTTTINSVKQQAGEMALRKGLHAYDQRHGFRGPVQHYELDENSDLEKLTEELDKFPNPGGLMTALAVEVEEEFAIVRLSDGQDVSIDFESSKWAAPYIDNYRIGNKPKNMQEIVKVGDVVMVLRNDSGVFELSQIPQVQGALVSMNPNDGGIQTLVGGYDFYLSKFNRVTQAKRQPGSGFKPIVYSAALEHGLHASSIINDAPIVFDDEKLERTWRPENYSEKFFGPTRLREGIVKSRNLVSIRVLRQIGINNGRDHILKFGFQPADIPSNLSISLGSPNVTPLEMSRAFSVFANGGFLVEPYLIKSIVNQSGEELLKHQPLLACDNCIDPSELQNNGPLKQEKFSLIEASLDTSSQQPEPQLTGAPRIISAENRFIIDSFMRDVVTRGTGVKALSLGRKDLSGKTGTANEQRDAWFNGYNPNHVASVWVGFDTPEPLGRGEVGGKAALPIWIEYMETALADEPESGTVIPPGIVRAPIDVGNGMMVKAGTPGHIYEYFMAGSLPEEAGVTQDKPDYDDLF
ncbi:penicillin-binding protein 1A [Marinicella sp. W31]|uniref:penicillin-binding protein 1A n=1 Tax=Marinicella sp. W31 TaxID=3023713 RepID=UPI0037581CD8